MLSLSNFDVKAYMAAQHSWVASVSNSGDRCLEMYDSGILIHFLRLYSHENEAEGVFEKNIVVDRYEDAMRDTVFKDDLDAFVSFKVAREFRNRGRLRILNATYSKENASLNLLNLLN